MKPKATSEAAFETAIESLLLATGFELHLSAGKTAP
jgi:hypothetical protein